VTFLAGDPAEMPFETPFDAVVGRVVLMHQPDPVAMLRKLSRMLRRAALLLFRSLISPRRVRSRPRRPLNSACNGSRRLSEKGDRDPDGPKPLFRLHRGRAAGAGDEPGGRHLGRGGQPRGRNGN
jgi:hypothetical protein